MSRNRNLLGIILWQELVEVEGVEDCPQISSVGSLGRGRLAGADQDVENGLDCQDNNQSEKAAEEDAEVVSAHHIDGPGKKRKRR